MELRTVNAVITGGASGLGRATAERIVKAGGRVALLDLPISKGADVAETLGGNAIFTPADVTHGEQVAGACEQARQRFGGINVLVNCAGVGTAAKTVGKQGAARLEDFTREVRELLASRSPEGVFWDWPGDTEIILARKPGVRS